MTVIMVCRNGLALSKACLKTLLAQTLPVTVLVVDNASTDGTGNWLTAQQTRHPFHRWTLQNVESVSTVWNLALNWAWGRGRHSSVALVVNNDTELLPETCRTLLIAKGSCGLITGVSVDREPVPPPDALLLSPHPDYSCFLITRETHRQVPFDEHYIGAYFEDADHHVRLHRAGIPAGSVPLEFRHRRSATLRMADAREQARINSNYEQNQHRFLQQYGCLPGTKAYAALFDHGQQSGQDPEGQPR